MDSQDPEIDEILAHHYFCGGCGAFLPLDESCSRCTSSFGKSLEADTPARTIDIVLSVIMAGMTLALTAPPTLMLIRVLFLFRPTADVLSPVVLVSVWNGYLMGYPVLILTRRWYHRIQLHQFGYAWLWGHYWRLQLHTLAPILIVAAFPAMILMGYWLSLLLK